jgi:hypothetical protein
VERQHQAVAGRGHPAQGVDGAVDFERARHEDQAVACGLFLHQPVGVPGGLLPHRLVGDGPGVGRICDGQGKHPAFARQHGTGLKPLGQRAGIERRRHHHQQQIGPHRLLGAAGQRKG